MGDIQIRGDTLTPERQQLLELLLKKKGIDVTRAKAIPRRGKADPCLLSFAQERLWFLHELEPQSTAYTMPAAFRLTGPLNVAALKQSLDEIVMRHESLRTTFSVMEG